MIRILLIRKSLPILFFLLFLMLTTFVFNINPLLPGLYPCMAENFASSGLDRPPGARSAGMGGAFTGLADDAFALYHNSAGLVNLPKKEIATCFESLTQDRSSTYISFAHPFYDNVTTMGVSYYRYGVDDISRTKLDTTNVIGVDSTGNPIYKVENDGYFSDSQNQFSIAFARRLNDFLAASLNTKYSWQTLDNDSASGFGLDFNILYEPYEYLNFGLSVRNIAQTMSWSNQSSRDDNSMVSLVAGAAVKFQDKMNFLLDFEKTENCDMEYHIGAEATLVERLILRLGLDDGKMTAGASLKLNAWRFDYSYFDDELGITHKLSSTLRFDAPGF